MRLRIRWPILLLASLACVPGCAAAQSATLGNFVWMDANRNGIQDAGESGIAGVSIQLWNGAMNALLGTTTTNANGTYAIVGPTGTALRVRALLPSGLLYTAKDQGASDVVDSDVNDVGTALGFTDSFTLASNVVSIDSIDAGMLMPQQANLGNFVWNDLDEDGVQDAGESGIAGVTVQLWNADRNALFASATTTAQGLYALLTPAPGDYRVRVVLPAGSTFSPKDQGANDLLDSDINPGIVPGFTDVYTITPNVISVTSIDAGIIGAVLFGDGFEDP